MPTFREWVLQQREERGLRDADVAVGLGCSVSTVARYKSGARHPEPQMVDRIAVYTGFRVMPNDWHPELLGLRRQARRSAHGSVAAVRSAS